MSFADDVPAIRDRIVEVLLSPECQGISFSYRGCVVNAAQYRAVAEHVRRGRIGILPRRGNGVHATAAYSPTEDAVYVAEGFLLSPGALWELHAPVCVHEMTHAVLDQQRLGDRPYLDSEIVAFVAEAWYRMRRGGATRSVGGITTERTVACARAIVSNYLRSRAELSVEAAASLRDALLAHDDYAPHANEVSVSDGIRGA